MPKILFNVIASMLLLVMSVLNICGTAPCFSIETIKSIHEIMPFFDQLDSDSLVVFDVDEVLIMCKDRIIHGFPKDEIESFKQSYWVKTRDLEYKEYLRSIIHRDYKMKLVELEMVEIIKKLQSRNIKVIVLTHMRSGECYTIKNMEKWRFEQLRDMAIDLSQPNLPNFVIESLPAELGEQPVFYNGVLATGRKYSKGEVLSAFLTQANLVPNKIIFLDDHKEHVVSVKEEMAKKGIPCKAFHYAGAAHKHAEKTDFEIARQQFDHLFEYEEWLSEEAVQQYKN